MQDERKRIEKEVEHAKASLAKKLNVIENDVRETVENIKESKDQIAQKVQEAWKAFDYKKQVKEHPIEMVGGAFVGGILLGTFAMRRGNNPEGKSPNMIDSVKDSLAEEWKTLKTIVVGEVERKIEKIVDEKAGDLAGQINGVLRSAAVKLGADKQTVELNE